MQKDSLLQTVLKSILLIVFLICVALAIIPAFIAYLCLDISEKV